MHTLIKKLKQVSADDNDGTVEQVSLSNNGTGFGEDRILGCVSILYFTIVHFFSKYYISVFLFQYFVNNCTKSKKLFVVVMLNVFI